MDVEGAFPNAVTDKLLHNLKKRRIPQIYVKFIKLMLSNRRTKLSFDDYTSDPINILNRIGQGDPLSMILYILYNADILEIIDDETHEGALGYVDDMALIATGNSFEDTTETLRNLMEKQDGGLSWSETHNSRFEMSKSAVLHFTRKTMMDLEDENNRIPVPKPPLTIGGQTIEEVQSYKYLGIQIDAQLRWKEQAQRAVANATKWLLQYRRLTRPTTGTSSRLMRQLYIAVALPKITYGLDIWYIPPSKKAGQTKNSGSAGALRQLQKVQRIASLAINGALRTTPTDFLDAHAGLLPIEFTLLKAAHRATIRLLTLPDTHPLYGIVKSTRDSPPTRHLSPIASLIKIFKLRRKKIETIRPAAQYPQVKAKFATETQKSREESIKQEKEDKSDFKVFSDSSGAEDGIGAAAVLYRKGRFSPIDKLKAFLGPPERHNTFEAEVVGAILAAQLLSSRPDAIGKTATIYIDNQSVIASLKNPKATAGQYLIRHLLHTANSLPCKLRLCWISGHSNVKGNEKVDELAKEAAEGNGSEAERLPQILRTPLPISTSANKQAYLRKLKHLWTDDWEESERGRRFKNIDEQFPFNSYRKRTNCLTRLQSSIMIQIRSGHIPLNGYLFKINRAESEDCPACLDEDANLRSRETVKHYLFECRAYNAERNEMIKKIPRRHLNLKDIMLSTDYIKALTRFINRTRRFKT